MKKSGNQVTDSLATFREYMRLERRRRAGLSPDEFLRWEALRKRLDREVGPLNGPGGAARRATPRIPTSLKVRFDSLDKMGGVLMRNLSRGGIFVEIDPPPAIGTKLKLRIEVIDPPREIELDGEVASLHVGPRFEVDQRGVGIRFSSLSPSDQSLVDDLYEQQAERYLDTR